MHMPPSLIRGLKPRHRISFPPLASQHLPQDEVTFQLDEGGEQLHLRFHDYGALYQRPGLYEQLFYERLKCRSPQKIAEIMDNVVTANGGRLSELRVLDVGAGNGIMGELLATRSVARLVGIDILEDAKSACERDRPGVYDAYYVEDLTALTKDAEQELESWQFDAMCCIAALGFGDIPVEAFTRAYNLVSDGGWAAFNVRDTFLESTDQSGFSLLIKKLLTRDMLEIHHLERYVHRISIDGSPLYYYALVGRKKGNITPAIIEEKLGW
ncbi:MAG TPA: class I SAM-dependent methyltransferase [Stenotrophobium sp.]|jgi:SAM-dependent methyltransferase|nr:class I SAM-dependent methyltransferase [Stenotrophobium sp.]